MNEPNLTRTFSESSSQTLKRLEDLEQQFTRMDDIVENANNVLNTFENVSELLPVKHQLEGLSGKLDKFQFESVDAISTMDLHSGRQIAKNHRKQLNKRVDALREEILAIHSQINKLVQDNPIPQEEKSDHQHDHVHHQHHEHHEQKYSESKGHVDDLDREEMKEGLLILERLRGHVSEEKRIRLKQRLLHSDHQLSQMIKNANGNMELLHGQFFAMLN